VVLGSATPSVQSYHNVKIGKFAELTLKKRVENRPLAEISIVDLRENRNERGFKRFFTRGLVEAMRKTLDRKEQVLLFLNRRGFATYPVCSVCGQAVRCRNCEVTLTLHKSFNAYQCHFCGYSMAASSACPSCGANRIVQLGLGTEKVEETAKKMFPQARIVRMDRDTTRRKGSLGKILKDLRDGSIDILVGTQMVAKGHDFPNITLVGILCADLSLGFPDFRAGERTFQLLAQVAGRAGRGQMSGQVVLQTYNPNHFSITAAKEQDFLRFYNQEIAFRKALSYPPFARLVQFAISGRDKKATGQFAKSFGNFLAGLQTVDPDFARYVEILGPIEAPLAKIDGKYRWQVLLKGLKTSLLHAFVNRLVYRHGEWFDYRRFRVAVDVDPYFML
jgi:primosomal protein N' (replication factor Y)